jgi:sugar lactone lactonase YvrE
VVEEGSDLAAELWGLEHPAASSVLAYPEGRAALAAARRAGRLSAAAHGDALQDFETTQRELFVLGVDELLARRVTTISAPPSTRSKCSLSRSCRSRTPTS